MSDATTTNITFRFVGMGTVAPDPVPENEIWMDVGNRVAPRVLDQHGADTDAWSSAALALERHKDLVVEPMRGAERAVIVLHKSPDLDAICAAWLAVNALGTGSPGEPRGAVERIVREVSYNDQGYLRASEPEKSWAVVFRTGLAVHHGGAGEEARVRAGLGMLDETLAAITAGGDLADAAERISTPAVHAEIVQARRDYLEDLSRGEVFQVRLPVRPRARGGKGVPSVPQPPPGPAEARWSLADGVFLHEPRSSLFRELARGDREHSPTGQGFALMVVTYDAGRSPAGRPLFRHVVSTDPYTGLHLRGLGGMLEELKGSREDARGEPLLPRRERVAPGTGRHGYDVKSPWYDGRAHDFTIVDSPAVEVRGRETCASHLSSAEVLDVVWEYGDPARFAEVRESELMLIRPVEVAPQPESRWPEGASLCERCPDLCEEVQESLGGPGGSASIRRLPPPEDPGLSDMVGHELWLFPDGTALWAGLFSVHEGGRTARDLCRRLGALRRRDLAAALPEGVAFSRPGRTLHLLHCRLRPTHVSLADRKGASARVMHQLAGGIGPSFSDRGEEGDLAAARTAASRDHRVLLYATERGLAVVSTKETPFDAEERCLRPEGFRALAALALAYRTALDRVAASFAGHRAEPDSMQAARNILADRWRLMRLEQFLAFARVTEHGFGQASYDALVRLLGIPELLADTREKIGVLAEHVRDARAAFYQRLAFWVSFLFAPLAITTAFFSGIHMERRFVERYLTFLPAGWEPAGWLLFLAFFVILAGIAGALWLVVTLGSRRSDILRWFRGGRGPGGGDGGRTGAGAVERGSR